MKRQRRERALGIFAIATILFAAIIGTYLAEGDIFPAIQDSFPEAASFDALNGNRYAALDENGTELGYVSLATANGYGGPMQVAVAVDLEGNILKMSIASHKETTSWMRKVMATTFLEDLFGKHFTDEFSLGVDIDAVTGATYTSRALAEVAMEGSRDIAGNFLGFEVAESPPPEIQFGIPEITLIGLFAIGYIGHRPNFKYKKQIRWASMLIGLIVLGVIYTRPLTLSDINKFLLGFWPAWQNNLYWYLLIGGMLLVFTVDNKNPYCEWFCPFGAAQECMGLIGGAKPRSAGKSKRWLVWVQRGLAWIAIVLALLFRNPGLTSYEIFGTFFDLTGSSWQFALLGIILVASLFIHRPWCKYLCPVDPVTSLYRTFRKWILESWKKRNRKRKAVEVNFSS